MEGFLQHVAPQFLHPALQSFGCGAFRPITGAFHPLYPAKAFSRHFDQYSLAQARPFPPQRPLFETREEPRSSPPYRVPPFAAPREGSSSPGSAASGSPGPRKDDDPPCAEDHDFLRSGHKLRCGVCGARLGPGVAQAHFVQELQHLYSLSAPPREPAPPHHDEDARWETYQRIKANRQRRLRMKTRKRHSVESLLYDDEPLEERPRKPEPRCEEDEPVDVEGDSIGWPEGALAAQTEVMEKEPVSDIDNTMRVPLNYSEDLEISSTNDGVQSPENISWASRSLGNSDRKYEGQAALAPTSSPANNYSKLKLKFRADSPAALERPAEVSTSDAWRGEAWGLAAEAYLKAARPMKPEGENLPSSTDQNN